MAKLCLNCQHERDMNELRRFSLSPPTAEIHDTVPQAQCVDCIESKMKQHEAAAEQAKIYAWFIQHMQEIPRDEEWKQKMLDRILPHN